MVFNKSLLLKMLDTIRSTLLYLRQHIITRLKRNGNSENIHSWNEYKLDYKQKVNINKYV